MSAFVIDAFEFCRVRERRDGEIAVADLPRLAQESVERHGLIRWSLEGGSDDQGRAQLNMSVMGTVRLECQRCLQPFEYEIRSDSALVLAKDEASADELDALLADAAVEVIVGSKACNILDLVEDDALLAIPLSPKHEVCPERLPSPEESAMERKESPFAVLKGLKRP